MAGPVIVTRMTRRKGGDAGPLLMQRPRSKSQIRRSASRDYRVWLGPFQQQRKNRLECRAYQLAGRRQRAGTSWGDSWRLHSLCFISFFVMCFGYRQKVEWVSRSFFFRLSRAVRDMQCRCRGPPVSDLADPAAQKRKDTARISPAAGIVVGCLLIYAGAAGVVSLFGTRHPLHQTPRSHQPVEARDEDGRASINHPVSGVTKFSTSQSAIGV